MHCWVLRPAPRSLGSHLFADPPIRVKIGMTLMDGPAQGLRTRRGLYHLLGVETTRASIVPLSIEKDHAACNPIGAPFGKDIIKCIAHNVGNLPCHAEPIVVVFKGQGAHVLWKEQRGQPFRVHAEGAVCNLNLRPGVAGTRGHL